MATMLPVVNECGLEAMHACPTSPVLQGSPFSSVEAAKDSYGYSFPLQRIAPSDVRVTKRRARAVSDSARNRDFHLGAGPRKNLGPRSNETSKAITRRKRASSVESCNSSIWRPFSFLIEDEDGTASSAPLSPLEPSTPGAVTFDDNELDVQMSQGLDSLHLQATPLPTTEADVAQQAVALAVTRGNKQAVSAAVSRLLLNHKQGTPRELKIKALRLVQQILEAVRTKKGANASS
eukprot:comp18053_c0_seq1/m.18609 comp18053_c0_seq1/g.18609  ORF comp18053_c0_seq1/g.18609 comp18053_c0_seq1/m.18609 type:complete len:235 (-) comp18053_c0_seq1:105-809(-)